MKSILIIEDEQAIADAVIHSVEREGFTATHCSRGSLGLEKLRSEDFSLLVLDVGLPDISGFELCKTIRTFSQLPIIFLTARSDEVDKIVGLEIGADDYLTKPFSPRELAARIKVVLKRVEPQAAPASAKPQPAAASLTIDHEKMLALFKGEKLDLTRYEFRLLSLLAKNPGRVYTRDMLLHKVWDDANASMDRTVDAHIKSLRSKFRSIDPAVDPIVTHRGSGYSFRDDL